MSDSTKQAFEFAKDVMKSIAALSTGVLTLTTTLVDKIFPAVRSDVAPLLRASWVLLLVAIGLSLLSAMAMAGSLDKEASPSIYSGNIVSFAGAAIIFFGLGILLLIAAAWKAL